MQTWTGLQWPKSIVVASSVGMFPAAVCWQWDASTCLARVPCCLPPIQNMVSPASCSPAEDEELRESHGKRKKKKEKKKVHART